MLHLLYLINMETNDLLGLVICTVVLIAILALYLRPKRCGKCHAVMRCEYDTDSCHPLMVCPRCGNRVSGYDF